jgi:amino acid transporter
MENKINTVLEIIYLLIFMSLSSKYSQEVIEYNNTIISFMLFIFVCFLIYFKKRELKSKRFIEILGLYILIIAVYTVIKYCCNSICYKTFFNLKIDWFFSFDLFIIYLSFIVYIINYFLKKGLIILFRKTTEVHKTLKKQKQ